MEKRVNLNKEVGDYNPLIEFRNSFKTKATTTKYCPQ